ncbi:hypothetical protein DFH11DRAFT_1499327 [Phellopilus nigrolimitatus]|nr:hypothetical protein DFH11DRAFT_1499327 [Phellopilus nigrolimitatus]
MAPASQKRSLRGGSNSFSSSTGVPTDSRPRRYSIMPRHSASSSLIESLQDSGSRPRASSKSSKDPGMCSLSKRASFIDLGDNSSKLSDNRLLGSIKGRLNRKRSAPLLSNTFFTPTLPSMESPTTPTGPGALQSPMTWSPGSLVCDDTHAFLNADLGSSPRSFKSERKRTAIPEEVIDGIGYRYRDIRQNLDDNSRMSDDEVDVSKGGYHALSFTKKGIARIHSYSHNEAPYMQSYNKVDLQNEAYFDLLLRRLNSTGMPSFHEYIVPPRSVLDLGCGQGLWAQEAASVWAEMGTKVVGYDLVDLIGEKPKSLPNLSWRRGNFVAYDLPFKSETFDLVRLANLTDAIPIHRWQHVLKEVRRVLTPHGRVELIDDELIFSYPDQTLSRFNSTSNSGSRTARSSWSGSDTSKSGSDNSSDGRHSQELSSSFLNLDLDSDQRSIDSAPGLCHDDSPSEDSCECLPTPTTELSDDLMTLVNTEIATQMPSAPLCQEIEKIYETMLEGSYNINSRPGDFLESLLNEVFGPAGKPSVIKDFQLSLLSPAMHDLVLSSKRMNVGQDSPKRGKKLFKLDREGRRSEKEKEIMDRLAMSQAHIHKSKALKILGASNGSPSPSILNVSDPISTRLSDESELFGEPMRPTMRSRTSSGISLLTLPSSTHPPSSASSTKEFRSRSRPTGLFLYPDQFLETTPHELEMYVTKHVHTLLGSKAAIDEHVLTNLKDEHGNSLVSPMEWHEMLWEYERSCRERFNLPDVGGQFDDFDDDNEGPSDPLFEPIRHSRTVFLPVATAINNRKRSGHASSGPSDADNSCTRVRRIRVFEAYKIG